MQNQYCVGGPVCTELLELGYAQTECSVVRNKTSRSPFADERATDVAHAREHHHLLLGSELGNGGYRPPCLAQGIVRVVEYLCGGEMGTLSKRCDCFVGGLRRSPAMT